ncbi:hypothetical protein SAMN02983003_2190 [Devosia enhydra]|uniref:Uncharacterized protein n=1 Tax=Devosia enhydra TaxID=665118 RepID=A0A1K2HY69_9HYPH|nr:hypothetical protein [Devosia enhydra]SFZ84745.1 hypothetical protein SAMN02983003_2190 [Devosia enhydra]
MRLLLCLLLVVLALPALAQSAEPVGADKASDGQFTGIAMVTDHLDWYAMFARPQTPRVSGQSHFPPGRQGALALMFSNAEPRNGVVTITCGIEAFDPDGSRQVHSGPCYEGPYRGPNIIHPTLLDLQFKIGPNERAGLAGFRITMRDAHARKTVGLAVSFIQGAAR